MHITDETMEQQKRGHGDSFQSKVVVYGIGEFIIVKKKEEDHKKMQQPNLVTGQN